MPRYLLQIAYDGTSFIGWQVQTKGRSIQATVQSVLEKIFSRPIALTGAGRTDANVHALGQTAHFDAPFDLDLNRFLLSMNALLPEEIRILSVMSVSDTFHARYSAVGKTYFYQVELSPVADPFYYPYRYHLKAPCSVSLIKEGASFLLGTHDFLAFAHHNAKGSAAKGSIRTMESIDVIEEPWGFRLAFRANGFLYKMVRNLAGTLLAVGIGKISPKQVLEILLKRERSLAPETAPPHALFLQEVHYPKLRKEGM